MSKKFMNTLKAGFWFMMSLSVTSKAWKFLEMSMYGETQERDVDTVMYVLFFAIVVAAYFLGKAHGSDEPNS